MFKFKGISSNDMQVVIEEEEHFIARASQRYEITEIEGKDGAIFDELGYSIVERPIYVQCLNINKIDDILAWLNGEGEFEYKGRKTTARFYSQLEPQRSSCIRIIDTTFIRDPFWNKADEDYQLVKDRKDKQASGEYIHVEDSSNCRCRIGIGGNQEKETRSGKNKIDLAKCQTKALNGVTVTYNKENNSITFNGTCTMDNTIFYITESGKSDYDNNLLIKKNYTLLVQYVSGSVEKYSVFRCSDKDWSPKLVADLTTLSSTNKKIYSTYNGSDTTIKYLSFRFEKGAVLNNFTIQLMLTDTVDTEYEMYGAMPSPNYPSKVQAVGGNVNYYDKSKEVIGFILANGNPQPDNTVWTHSDFIEVNSNEVISITCENKANGQFTIVEYDKDKKFLKHNVCNYKNTEADNKYTITTTSTTKYVIGAYRNDSNMNNIMIVKGSKVLPYNPNCNGMGAVKVTKCNKNLFDENNKLMNATINSNGIIATGQDNYLFYFPVEYGHKYIFSTDFSESLTTNIVFGYCSEIPSIGVLSTYNVISLSNLKNKIFTPISEQNKYLCIRLNYTTQYNKMSNIQLEENTVSTSYEEHQEQSYIMPVQQEMLENDYFDFENEEEVHVWNKIILIGDDTEKWLLDSSSDKFSKFYFNTSYSATSARENVLCTHFSYGDVNYLNKNCIQPYNKDECYGINIAIDNNIAKNTAELKTWLKTQYDAGTPVIVYYKLATPTRIAFTDEQKAVAKELNNARTYKNVTNITTDSKAKLSLDYFTVTDETIKNEGNIQSRPVLRLEKTVSEAVEITINNVRFKYNFNNDTYVEIDCENKTVEYEGINRNRNLFIGYDFPQLNIGSNNIIMNDGDCIIKVIRKDRWL